MNQGLPEIVFQGMTTYIDFHLSFDQSRSHLYRELQKVVSPPLEDSTPGPCYGYTPGSPKWKTYKTNAPAYVVLNALETCDYKVVAASSIASGTQCMWTLQGPVDRDVQLEQLAHASSFLDYPY